MAFTPLQALGGGGGGGGFVSTANDRFVFVDAAAPAGGDGTANKPFNTILAASLVMAGRIVWIMPGTYDERACFRTGTYIGDGVNIFYTGAAGSVLTDFGLGAMTVKIYGNNWQIFHLGTVSGGAVEIINGSSFRIEDATIISVLPDPVVINNGSFALHNGSMLRSGGSIALAVNGGSVHIHEGVFIGSDTGYCINMNGGTLYMNGRAAADLTSVIGWNSGTLHLHESAKIFQNAASVNPPIQLIGAAPTLRSYGSYWTKDPTTGGVLFDGPFTFGDWVQNWPTL